MNNRRLLPALTLLAAASLACAGLDSTESDCGRMALSREEAHQLLTAWEGRYLMADYCPIGDCPPSPTGTTTMVIDPDRMVVEWSHADATFKSIDMNETCLSGMTSSTGTGFGSTSILYGKMPAEEIVFDLRYDERGAAMMNINWPDPAVTDSITPGTKVWSGSVTIIEGNIIDAPPSAKPEGRRRSLDSDFRDEIWLAATWIPGQ